MNDPHVKALRYTLRTGIEFNNPSPVHHGTSRFDLDLEDGQLLVSMHEHHATKESAQAIVELILRAWEIHGALELHLRGREWRFISPQAEIVDRRPIPGGAMLVGIASGRGTGTAHLTVRYPSYPSLPASFSLDADVRTLWDRYEGHLLGREPLAAMAYFCLTVLEWRAGDRKRAATYYHVDKKVFDKLGELSSTKGTPLTARKAQARSEPMLPTEELWVTEVVRRLIIRAGEIAYDTQRPWQALDMSDFTRL